MFFLQFINNEWRHNDWVESYYLFVKIQYSQNYSSSHILFSEKSLLNFELIDPNESQLESSKHHWWLQFRLLPFQFIFASIQKNALASNSFLLLKLDLLMTVWGYRSYWKKWRASESGLYYYYSIFPFDYLKFKVMQLTELVVAKSIHIFIIYDALMYFLLTLWPENLFVKFQMLELLKVVSIHANAYLWHFHR